MFHKIYRIIYFVAAFFVFTAIFPYNTNAADKIISVGGRVYEFDKKSGYEISSCEPVLLGRTIGNFSVSGNIVKNTEKNNIPTFEITDGETLRFLYTYDDTMLNAAGTDEHLTSDSKKSVDNIELGEKIQKGAVVLQTSLDGQKWIIKQKHTNVFENTPVQTEPFYETMEVQLINGCYYRFIVAYETEKEIESSKILWVDKKNYEYKKYAEVYEFYASYGNKSSVAPSEKDRTFTLGEVTNTGVGNGYSGSNPLTVKDPHYGWNIGSFYVSGYTEKTDDNIFLKNVGDKITLWFKPEQDIDCLNGNDKLSITGDAEYHDQYFQTQQHDGGRGTLVIRYTDYRGTKHEPIIYDNYLEAFISANADTKVYVFEEGDYEVALDYKIKNDKFIDSYNDYRIFFTFKIRNGNCMVYPFDIKNGNELTNSSVTENGFFLDLAQSRYLKINVERSRWVQGANGYTEDVRKNGPAKDGDKYDEEGIYTIEVTNPTTGKTTEKKIYVGQDSIMIASMNPKNSNYSLDQIAELVEQGAEIQKDGTIIIPEPPETEPPITETETVAETSDSTESVSVTETSAITESTAETTAEEAVPVSAKAVQYRNLYPVWIIIISVIIAAAAGGAVIYIGKNKKKQ